MKKICRSGGKAVLPTLLGRPQTVPPNIKWAFVDQFDEKEDDFCTGKPSPMKKMFLIKSIFS
jgi:hypothetical protein